MAVTLACVHVCVCVREREREREKERERERLQLSKDSLLCKQGVILFLTAQTPSYSAHIGCVS